MSNLTSSDDVEIIVKRVFMEMVASEAFRQIVDAHCNARLSAFGIDWKSTDGVREFIEDQLYLRAWRKSMEKAKSVSWITALTILVTGTLGAIWLGIETILKHNP